MAASPQLEEILFQCLESDDFDHAVEAACSTYADLSADIRRLADSIRLHGLLASGTPGSRPEGSEASNAAGTDPGVTDTGPRELGGHELLEVIGEGGMGVIYRAYQRSTGREVALKVLRPELHFFDTSRARFRREIEAFARLAHPSIVPVFDAGEDRGIPFFTMEYVRGASLASVLKELRDRDPASLRGEDIGHAVARLSGMPDIGSWNGSYTKTIMRACRDLSAALAHAHDCGVLHRDVKPSNILLRPDGRAQILDFGLANLAGSERLSGSGPLGTPAYMPPEMLGDVAPIPNPRFDVYGIGLVLYETLTLEQPFLAPGAEATRSLILRHEVPSPRRRNKQVRWDLDIVCSKAMAREPEERYASIAALAEDLGNVLEDRPIRARRPGLPRRIQRWARRRATPLLAIGSALFVALAASAWLLVRERDARHRIEKALYRSNVTIAEGHLSRGLTDEARVALAECPESLRGWEWSYQSLLCDASEGILTRHAPLNHSIAISPDGSLLASCGSKCARIVDLRTDTVLHEFALQDTNRLCFAGEGRYLVVSTLGPLCVVFDVHTGARVREIQERAYYLACFGNTLVYGKETGELRILELPLGEPGHTVRAHDSQIYGVAIGPDGTTCATAAEGRVRLWTFPAFERLAEWSTCYPLVVDLCYFGRSDVVMVATSDVTRGLVRVERFSTDAGLAAWPERPRGTNIAVSRDGEYVAISAASVHMRRGENRPFDNVYGNSSPTVDLEYSPDGSKLYAMCNDGTVHRFSSSGGAALFRVPLGIGAVRRLVTIDTGRVACASSSGKIAIIDLRTREIVARAELPGGRVEGLVHVDDSLVVVTREGTWTSRSKDTLERLDGGDLPATDNSDTRQVVSVVGFSNGFGVALDTGDVHVRRDSVWSRLGPIAGVQKITSSSRGELYAIDRTGRVHVVSSAKTRTFETGLGEVLAANFVRDRLVFATKDKQLVHFDPVTGHETLRLSDLRRVASAVVDLPGMDRWAYVDWSGDVSIHAHDEMATRMRADLTAAMLLDVTADPNGAWLATAGLDGTLYVLTARRLTEK
ncbi:MAG: protein kinase [Planctomycetes bacterium]|nr:protein kinase [Planctomycetota bacterium]